MNTSATKNQQATRFNQQKKTWIWNKINRNHSKDQVFQLLLQQGFSHQLIALELNYDPSDHDRVSSVNPKSAATSSNSATSRVTIPIATAVDNPSVELFTINDFLNHDECTQLAELIKQHCRPSTITNPDEPDKYFRTSQTCNLSQLNHPLVWEINRRICKAMGINPSYSEGLQGQYYRQGEEFKPHTDYFGENDFAVHCEHNGQRSWTFMIYLNVVEAGGATHFPQLDLTIQPTLGQALIWNNHKTDGTLNPDTLHHGTTVEAGEKIIMTKWFREKGEGVMNSRDPKETMPRYTEQGFKKLAIPSQLYQQLLEYYQTNRDQAEPEFIDGGYIAGPDKKNNSRLIPLSNELKQTTHEVLQPILEQWSGIELEPTFVYGVREYGCGARLIPHRDCDNTHIISATLHLDESVDQPWPFEIDDHHYRHHALITKPGDMLLYESLTLLHSRASALNGTRYVNLYAHFKPRA